GAGCAGEGGWGAAPGGGPPPPPAGGRAAPTATPYIDLINIDKMTAERDAQGDTDGERGHGRAEPHHRTPRAQGRDRRRHRIGRRPRARGLLPLSPVLGARARGDPHVLSCRV